MIHRYLLDNITNPATDQVIVADGSAHTIEALGTLLGHPSIHADHVPTFTNNLIGVSHIIDNCPVGIIQNDKMVILDRDPYVDKLVNFVINYSSQNNLVLLTGSRSHSPRHETLCYLSTLTISIIYMIWCIIFIQYLIVLI